MSYGIHVIPCVICIIVHAQLTSCMQNGPICAWSLNCCMNYDILQLRACKCEQRKKKKAYLVSRARLASKALHTGV